MSKYEEHLINLFKKERIPFEREKTFNDLKHGLLRYDFFLPVGKGILIECDGEQHFNHISKFYKTRKDFLAAKERDRKKNAYALAKGFNLYRIPYYDIQNLTVFAQLVDSKYLVKTIYHNDLLINNAKNIKK